MKLLIRNLFSMNETLEWNLWVKPVGWNYWLKPLSWKLLIEKLSEPWANSEWFTRAAKLWKKSFEWNFWMKLWILNLFRMNETLEWNVWVKPLEWNYWLKPLSWKLLIEKLSEPWANSEEFTRAAKLWNQTFDWNFSMKLLIRKLFIMKLSNEQDQVSKDDPTDMEAEPTRYNVLGHQNLTWIALLSQPMMRILSHVEGGMKNTWMQTSWKIERMLMSVAHKIKSGKKDYPTDIGGRAYKI